MPEIVTEFVAWMSVAPAVPVPAAMVRIWAPLVMVRSSTSILTAVAGPSISPEFMAVSCAESKRSCPLRIRIIPLGLPPTSSTDPSARLIMPNEVGATPLVSMLAVETVGMTISPAEATLARLICPPGADSFAVCTVVSSSTPDWIVMSPPTSVRLLPSATERWLPCTVMLAGVEPRNPNVATGALVRMLDARGSAWKMPAFVPSGSASFR